MTLLWCSSKFAQLYKLSHVIKLIFNTSLCNIDNIAPLVVNIYLGLRPWEIFLPWVQYLASEFSHVCVQLRFQIRTYIYICMWPYVKLYAHARWYVMWEGLSVNHFLKHSSHFK